MSKSNLLLIAIAVAAIFFMANHSATATVASPVSVKSSEPAAKPPTPKQEVITPTTISRIVATNVLNKASRDLKAKKIEMFCAEPPRWSRKQLASWRSKVRKLCQSPCMGKELPYLRFADGNIANGFICNTLKTAKAPAKRFIGTPYTSEFGDIKLRVRKLRRN